MSSIKDKIVCWQLNRCTLSIRPVLAKRTPRGIPGLYGKQEVIIRFNNEVDWTSGELQRAISTVDATKAYNLFATEEEARDIRNKIVESIEATPILLAESKATEEPQECQGSLSEQSNSTSSTTKSKRKTKKKQSKEQKPPSKWDLEWAADGLSEIPNSSDTSTQTPGKPVEQKDNPPLPSI